MNGCSCTRLGHYWRGYPAMSDVLKPCPNPDCGSRHVHSSYNVQYQKGYRYFCICKKCLMRGPHASDRGTSVKLYNALPRTEPDKWQPIEQYNPSTIPGRVLLDDRLLGITLGSYTPERTHDPMFGSLLKYSWSGHNGMPLQPTRFYVFPEPQPPKEGE